MLCAFKSDCKFSRLSLDYKTHKPRTNRCFISRYENNCSSSNCFSLNYLYIGRRVKKRLNFSDQNKQLTKKIAVKSQLISNESITFNICWLLIKRDHLPLISRWRLYVNSTCSYEIYQPVFQRLSVWFPHACINIVTLVVKDTLDVGKNSPLIMIITLLPSVLNNRLLNPCGKRLSGI